MIVLTLVMEVVVVLVSVVVVLVTNLNPVAMKIHVQKEHVVVMVDVVNALVFLPTPAKDNRAPQGLYVH